MHSLEEPVIAQEQEETALEIELQPEVVAANIEDIEVTDHLEVVPVSEVSKGRSCFWTSRMNLPILCSVHNFALVHFYF